MVKSTGQTEGGRRLLAGCVVVLALFAVLPLSVTSWVSYFARVPRALIIPASSQVARLASWMGGAQLRPPPQASAEEALRELMELRTQVLQLTAENERLERALREVGAIVKVQSGVVTQSIVAPVVGSFAQSPGSLLRVKAGSSDGVVVGTVAVGPLLQIVGIVTSVESRTCTIRLITTPTNDKNDKSGIVQGEIAFNEEERIRCVLQPTSGGLLRGDVEWLGDAAMRERLAPQAGQYVRLVAENPWPRSANMLIIGTVERVEQSLTAPGRKAVVVRPTVDPLSRVGEVILRLEAGSGDAAGTTVRDQTGARK